MMRSGKYDDIFGNEMVLSEDMKISLVIKGTEKSWRWTGDIEGRIQQKPGVLSAQLSS